MISMVIITLLIYRGAQINTGHFPYGNSSWAFASQIVASWLHPSAPASTACWKRSSCSRTSGLSRAFWCSCPTRSTCTFSWRRSILACRVVPRARWSRQDSRHGYGERHRRHGLWRGQSGGLHLEADVGLRDLHRVRRCQSVCPAWTTGKPLSPKLLIMGLRDNMFASADRLLSVRRRATWRPWCRAPSIRTCCGPARRVAVAWSSAPSTSSTWTPSSTCVVTKC